MAIHKINTNKSKSDDSPSTIWISSKEDIENLSKQDKIIADNIIILHTPKYQLTSDENLAVAKKIDTINGTRFFIKTTGTNNRPFNPRTDNLQDKKSHTQDLKWKFTEINIHGYQQYIHFIANNSDYAYKQASLISKTS